MGSVREGNYLTRSEYRIAQICMNGHVVTDDITYQAHMAPHCKDCGADTLTHCPSCGAGIRGRYYVPDVFAVGDEYHAPSYCHNCGKPFPWTAAKTQALRELVEESEGLSEDEKERLARSIDDLVADTPQTNVAVVRAKKWLMKAGGTVGPSVRQIIVDIGTEAVKKSMGL